MQITALAENVSHGPLVPEHGLSLYITAGDRRILFDVGPQSGVAFANAEKLGIDVREVDTVIISHGHDDHGGALGEFLRRNDRAAVYVQRSAFGSFYSTAGGKRRSIGLDEALAAHPRVRLLDGDHELDDTARLITAESGGPYRSEANDRLFAGEYLDDFRHEQDLVLREGDRTALITGCGHCGIVNILERTRDFAPQLVIGGFHLCVPPAMTPVRDELLSALAQRLGEHPARFYTCHCTGQYSYEYLRARCPNVGYISCGETVTL